MSPDLNPYIFLVPWLGFLEEKLVQQLSPIIPVFMSGCAL